MNARPPLRRDVGASASAQHAYEMNCARIASLWAEAQPVTAEDAAGRFLHRSGVMLNATGSAPGNVLGSAWPAALRMHQELEYWHVQRDKKAIWQGRFPALLALYEIDVYPRGVGATPVSHAVALQRIYLTHDGDLAPVPAPIKLTGKAGPALGACARLAPLGSRNPMPNAAKPGGVMGIAVGVTAALRIAQAARMPVWAVPDANWLAHARWPRSVRSLHVFVDAKDPLQWTPAAELARKGSACGLQVFPVVTDLAHANVIQHIPAFTAAQR